MRRTTLALACLLSGCSYLGSAREWDPAEADPEFVLIPELAPIRQKDSVGCGPVALALVLRHYGESVGPEDLTRELPPAGDAGSTAGALRDAARRLGYKAHVIEGTFEDLEEHLRKGRPLIVGLVKPFITGAVPHYEVVAGVHPVRGSVATLDPVRGWTLNSREGFLEEWAGSGRLLLVIAPSQTRPE